jgi:hypothetical protein
LPPARGTAVHARPRALLSVVIDGGYIYIYNTYIVLQSIRARISARATHPHARTHAGSHLSGTGPGTGSEIHAGQALASRARWTTLKALAPRAMSNVTYQAVDQRLPALHLRHLPNAADRCFVRSPVHGALEQLNTA